MSEIFFCTAPKSDERRSIAGRMFDIWDTQQFCYELTPKLLRCTDSEFQKQRRMFADKMADGEIYLLVDDDCEPILNSHEILKHWISCGERIMRENHEFAILSAWPANANIERWAPHDYSAKDGEEVTEHVSVGGLRFVRKGCMKDWPEQIGPGYDREHCEALRASGYRVGYFKHLKMIHHGEGKSEVWSSAQ